MVYDCFQFFNELDLLKMRLNILNDVVDKFVISEATVTFSGNKKPLYFAENRNEFKEFEDKIIYQLVDDTPDVNPYMRDSFQKCAVKRPLVDCKDDDVIIFSDVDEIPNPAKIKELLNNFDAAKVYHMAQRMFYCYLNVEEVTGQLLSITGEFDGIQDKKWLGTKVCAYSFLKPITTESLRSPDKKECGIRVEDGGWHFSYMGRRKDEKVTDTVAYKIKSAAHQELNNLGIMLRLKRRINNRKDLFGRQSRFEIVPIDDTFPQYLREHLNEYDHLLKKE